MTKIAIALSMLVGLLVSPIAVAKVAQGTPDSPTSMWQSAKDLGPVGVLVVGFLYGFWRIWKTLQPRVEKWLDAGTAEREEMRGLARFLRDRFGDEDRKDREAMRDALRALQVAKDGRTTA